MQYRIFRTFGKATDTKNKHQKKNFDNIIEKHGITLYPDPLKVGDVIEFGEAPDTMLLEDSTGNLYELLGV